jgi:glycosyltransferase involved in cell wall biosynthesis
MNILHFGKFHRNAYSGGLEAYVESLAQTIGQTNTVINLVANTHWRTFQEQANHYQVQQVASLGQFFSTSLCPTMPYWARKLDKQYHFDLAHLHFPDPMSHLASMFLPKRVKKIVTWHSDIIKQKKLARLYNPLLKHFLNSVDAVIVSNNQAGSFPQLMDHLTDHKKIHVIPTGINIARFTEPNTAAIHALQKTYAKPIIFALGRHVYYKGFSYLIQAMQKVNDAVLVIGGSGPLNQELKQQVANLNLQTKVFFPGRIVETEIANYFHAAALFCLPSIATSESYGLVQLEAMACGKPVVCCELNNGVTFVNQHQKTGLVVPPKDSAALAQALNVLLHDKTLREQLGYYAKNRVTQEFTEQSTIERTLALYADILQS